MSLLQQIREDRSVNGHWGRAGFQAVALHRVGVARKGWPLPLRSLSFVIYGPATFLVRRLYGIEIPETVSLGRRVEIGHQSGIVIVDGAVIGDDCVILQNVTIGARDGYHGAPRLGRNVEVYPGAVIFGPITIGDDVRIGPNAVVSEDVPSDATVMAPPSRVVGVDRNFSSRARAANGHPSFDEFLEVLARIVKSSRALAAETPLLSSGLVDSLQVTVLLDELDARFDVKVPGEEVTVETFDTPAQMFDTICRLAR